MARQLHIRNSWLINGHKLDCIVFSDLGGFFVAVESPNQDIIGAFKIGGYDLNFINHIDGTHGKLYYWHDGVPYNKLSRDFNKNIKDSCKSLLDLIKDVAMRYGFWAPADIGLKIAAPTFIKDRGDILSQIPPSPDLNSIIDKHKKSKKPSKNEKDKQIEFFKAPEYEAPDDAPFKFL